MRVGGQGCREGTGAFFFAHGAHPVLVSLCFTSCNDKPVLVATAGQSRTCIIIGYRLDRSGIVPWLAPTGHHLPAAHSAARPPNRPPARFQTCLSSAARWGPTLSAGPTPSTCTGWMS